MNLPFQRQFTSLSLFLLAAAAACVPSRADDMPAVKPIHALLITGGCCHDYVRQKQILTKGISARANVQWKIFYENGDTKTEMGIYSNPDFAKGFDWA